MDYLHKLVHKDLKDDHPNLHFKNNILCEACQKGKQVRASFKAKNNNIVFTYRPLKIIHMDLFGPYRTISLCRNAYELIVMDDYSRYVYTLILSQKRDVLAAF